MILSGLSRGLLFAVYKCRIWPLPPPLYDAAKRLKSEPRLKTLRGRIGEYLPSGPSIAEVSAAATGLHLRSKVNLGHC